MGSKAELNVRQMQFHNVILIGIKKVSEKGFTFFHKTPPPSSRPALRVYDLKISPISLLQTISPS